MSMPDWTEAPTEATHWDTAGAVWCKPLFFWYDGAWIREAQNNGLFPEQYKPRPLHKSDWSKASKAATHWDNEKNVFCNVHGWWSGNLFNGGGKHLSWGSDRYTPRPVAQSDRTQLVTALNQLRNEADVGVVADAILSIGFRLER